MTKSIQLGSIFIYAILIVWLCFVTRPIAAQAQLSIEERDATATTVKATIIAELSATPKLTPTSTQTPKPDGTATEEALATRLYETVVAAIAASRTAEVARVTATATESYSPTSTPSPSLTPTPTADETATVVAIETQFHRTVQAVIAATYTAEAHHHTPTATHAPTYTPKPTKTATKTPRPTSTPNKTVTIVAQRTAVERSVRATLTANAPTATRTRPVFLRNTPTPNALTFLSPLNRPKPIAPKIGDRWINPKDGATYLYVPAGEFLMGSSEVQIDEALALCVKYYQEATGNECKRSWYEDEAPQHTAYMDGYWIMETEVTNAHYAQCVEAGACEEPDNSFWDDANMKIHPVVDISWHQAQAYSEWAGGRLPTEAEWEKAARGTDGRLFPWGNQWDSSKANYCDRNCEFEWKDEEGDDGSRRTAPVGSYPDGASPYGALDMAGNVWEWTADWGDANYYARSPERNPQGPSDGTRRVLRGGSFLDNPGSIRATSRINRNPSYQNNNVGVRVVAAPGF